MLWRHAHVDTEAKNQGYLLSAYFSYYHRSNGGIKTKILGYLFLKIII